VIECDGDVTKYIYIKQYVILLKYFNNLSKKVVSNATFRH